MLIPMMGFFLMLTVVGGLGSLVTMADPTRAKLFPLMLAMLFAGLSPFCLLFCVPLLEGLLSHSLFDMLFFLSFPIFVVGAAILGFIIGSRRNQKNEREN
jgi:hypothetical protein